MNVSEDKEDISLSLNDYESYLDNINLCSDTGDYYFEIKQYIKAIKKYKRALETCLIAMMNSEDENNQLLEIELNLRKKLYNSAFEQGNTSSKNHKYEEALEYYIEALDLNTGDEIIYTKIGKCFKSLKNENLAIKYFQKSIDINPDYPNNYNSLGDIYSAREDYKNALECYENYIDLNDKNEYVYNMLGFLHHKTHDIKKSLLYFQIAAELNPFFQTAQSNFLYASVKMPDFTQQEIYNLAVSTSMSYIKNTVIAPDNIFTHKKRKKNKKIKIGYISGDIKSHVVMNYILPILENHNKTEFEIYCYYNNDSDWVTQKCEEYFNQMTCIKDLSDYESAEKIYNDKIDILVDLSGHTACNKVFVMAYKPAPVQITYVGYPNTTGINTIDYFLTNKNLNSVDDEKYYSEKLYYMDSVYRCFKYYYKNILPPVLDLPYFRYNHITFGVFNDLSKINEQVIEVWAEILKNKENSKLLICRTSIIEDYYIDKFAELGIEKERLIFKNKFSLKEYHEVDIQLDTFPFCGVTVVFDSINMGVPVLTLRSDMFQGREAANINFNLGLENFIADSKEDYIKKAVELSSDIKMLKNLRKTLRKTLHESDFYKYADFTKKIEDSYKDMYSKIQNETAKTY